MNSSTLRGICFVLLLYLGAYSVGGAVSAATGNDDLAVYCGLTWMAFWVTVLEILP